MSGIQKLLISLLTLAAVLLALLTLNGLRKAAVERADKAETKVAELTNTLKNRKEVVKTVTEYVDRVHTIHVKGDTIIKEVTRYVSPEADAACTVPVGFVRMHNAAAANQPDPSLGAADAAPAGIALSTASETIATNYTTCHANAEQLTRLQASLRRQGVVVVEEEPDDEEAR